jgi:signal transduction histidine kinase
MLFFVSLTALLILFFYADFQRRVEYLKDGIFAQMRLCSFDLQCPEFKIDFVKREGKKPLFLYENSDGFVSYFEFFGSRDSFISIKYSLQKFKESKMKILQSVSFDFIKYEFLIIILSLLFSFYAMRPMRKALRTIDEFIKDILHDINTPITTIALNSALLKQDDKNRNKIEKINLSIKKILTMQDNLVSYLGDMPTQTEIFDLRSLIKDQQEYYSSIYNFIRWQIDKNSFKLHTNKKIFIRIISNIISNASKYNKKNGLIIIRIDPQKSLLYIEDTGMGIKDTKRVFDRFYKESDRGTGVGLNIVKKLCDELGIKISVESKVGVGTIFTLDLKSVRA